MKFLRFKTLPLFLLLSIYVSNIFTQEQQILNLDFCIESFLNNSQEYKYTKLEFEKAVEQLRAATAFKYPNINVAFRSPYTYSKGENEVFYYPENKYRSVHRNTKTYLPSFSVHSDYYLPTDGRLSSSVVVYYNSFLSNLGVDRKQLNTFVYFDYEQPLFRKNHYSLDSKIAEMEFKKSELHIYSQRNKLIAQLIDRFYIALQAQQKYELLRSQFRQKELTHYIVMDKYKLGKISELEFLQAEIDYKNNQLNLLNQKELMQNEITALCLFIGISPDTSYRCSVELNLESFDFSLEECLNRAISRNPKISIAMLAKEISNLRMRRAASAKGLNLSFVSSISFDNRRDYLPFISDSRFYNWSVGMRASLPLWDGGKDRAERRLEKLSHRQEEMNLTKMRNSLIQEIKKLYSAMRFEKSRIDILRKKMTLTQKALRLSRHLHEIGRMNMRDLLESEVKAKQAEIDMLNSIINYNKIVNTLKLKIGMDFGI